MFFGLYTYPQKANAGTEEPTLVRIKPSPIIPKHDFVNLVSLRLSLDDLSFPDTVIKDLGEIAEILKTYPRACVSGPFYCSDGIVECYPDRMGVSSEAIFGGLVDSVRILHRNGKLGSQLSDVLEEWRSLQGDLPLTILNLQLIIQSHIVI